MILRPKIFVLDTFFRKKTYLPALQNKVIVKKSIRTDFFFFSFTYTNFVVYSEFQLLWRHTDHLVMLEHNPEMLHTRLADLARQNGRFQMRTQKMIENLTNLEKETKTKRRDD